MLTGQPLNFFGNRYPVPLAVSAESGGPGDDVRVECEDGVVVEIQAKRGLVAGDDFWGAVTKLIGGLVEDPALLGVLLVDYTTSISVREHFRRGVRRLAEGRTDGLDEHTTKLPTKLEEARVATDLSALGRFAVVVRDLHDGSHGHENALLMLDGVAEYPPAAWTALDSDAHDLIENRGRRDAQNLALTLSTEGGGLSRKAEQPAAVAQAYRDWLTDVTSRFRVPGAAVSLRIGEAWAELEAWQEGGGRGSEGGGLFSGGRTVEERIASYREWSRLGLRDGISRPGRTFGADNLPMAGDRLVVVAGPGAGKSTLQRRLANGLSREGANVAHVRLPLVAERVRAGATFGEAVLDLAASESGLGRAVHCLGGTRPDSPPGSQAATRAASGSGDREFGRAGSLLGYRPHQRGHTYGPPPVPRRERTRRHGREDRRREEVRPFYEEARKRGGVREGEPGRHRGGPPVLGSCP